MFVDSKDILADNCDINRSDILLATGFFFFLGKKLLLLAEEVGLWVMSMVLR